MEVSLPTDADGFLSQECPSCEQRFKVAFGQGSEDPISYCPYCGYNGQACWHTQEQVTYMQAVAVDVALSPELRKLERQLKGMSTGIFKIDLKSNLPAPPPAPIEADGTFNMLHFPCCNESIKVTRHDRHFCIICGTEVDMEESELKKVFLSHKGVDKAYVVDFKKSLEILGYDPWLDEDAMPAGTPLERGILKGMQDSCGVVFFITPSFKDTGYLETEINYALREKRRKGDKFAIVPLQIDDGKGSASPIPALLEPFVWKKPKSQLAALREIIRSLPVVPGVVDWRDSITGVVAVPKTKSTSSPLSKEAEVILKAAATSGGIIHHHRLSDGERIECDEKQMIPARDSRTVARWVGGLEDLQRRRYVKDLSHKGETFEVTREGYEAADELSKDGGAPE